MADGFNGIAWAPVTAVVSGEHSTGTWPQPPAFALRSWPGGAGVLSEVLAEEFGWSMAMDWRILFLRVLGGLVLTGLIGLERESRNKSAGLRTHMMVGLAATTYSIITTEIVAGSYNDAVRLDPLRIVEAVTSGVAFLAAGMIVFSKGEVRGLTTGASLWLAASIGLATGLGMWPLALAAALLGLFIARLTFLIPARRGKPASEVDHSEPSPPPAVKS
jgi:putative Mg2+ transporter-C (MgtC) family protein